VFLNQAIRIKVIDLKYQRRLLIKAWAVQSEKAIEKLTLIQVTIVVRIHNTEESFTKYARKLGIVKEWYLIDSFVWVVWSALEILVDVFEVW